MIIGLGVEVNARTNLGRTSLHIAVIRRQDETVALLLENFTDLLLLDIYGRNCFDYAKASRGKDSPPQPLSVNATTPHPSAVVDAQNKGIVHGLNEINKKRNSKEPSIQNVPWFDMLGKILLLQGNQDDARTAYEQSFPEVECDSCNARNPDSSQINRIRFVCCTCVNIDLCERCMEDYKANGGTVEMEAPELCEHHEFFKVSSSGRAELEPGQVNHRGETEDEWLGRVERKYGGEACDE